MFSEIAWHVEVASSVVCIGMGLEFKVFWLLFSVGESRSNFRTRSNSLPDHNFVVPAMTATKVSRRDQDLLDSVWISGRGAPGLLRAKGKTGVGCIGLVHGTQVGNCGC